VPIGICEQKFKFTYYLDLPSQIPVNKEWVFWSHLVSYTSLVTKLVFPSGHSNVATEHSMLFSKSLASCNRTYQCRGPENCEKSNLWHTSEVWNFLIVTAYNFINLLNTKRRLLYLKTQFVPRSKHFSSRL
jgi:hypothetical protein